MQFSMHTTSNNQGVGTVLELPGIDTKLREVLKEAIASFMVRPQADQTDFELIGESRLSGPTSHA